MKHIEGSDPPRPLWTCADIELWLKTAFKALPTTPIYAPRGNTLVALSGVPSATFDIIAFTGTVLGDRSEERLAVLIWARAKATKGEVGGSIAQFCSEKGWSRSTFEDRRRRACERIAEAKNRADAADTDRAATCRAQPQGPFAGAPTSQAAAGRFASSDF